MQPDYKKEAERWFIQATRDSADADTVKNNKIYNLACFLYQQSAEKAIKAFLYAQELEEVWGHSVADLCKKSQKYNKKFSSLIEDAYYLDKFYIPTRYPNGLPGGIPSEAFGEREAESAQVSCHKIIEFVRNKVQV